jgi:small subunit ribosomal protein S8
MYTKLQDVLASSNIKENKMLTDPIADALTRIRNANMVKHESVTIPASKLKVELVKLLKEEGYISDYEVVKEDKFSNIVVTLKYAGSTPVITGLKRVSSPGLRTYTKAKHVPKVYDGMGIAVISTSKGLMTDRRAKEAKLGGEILCYVW